ncbi:DUF2993 domain-containing protein [Frigoribacterium sp. 2-23]|uniref:LmeA family phospholipid-binding protein n=1 Tax=Frigoribacterium sp. 2-23 TaxID=3415006 RepID=UPI003C6EC84A
MTDDFFEARAVPRRRGRGAGIALFVVVGLVLILAIIAVIADFAARAYAEDRAAKQITQSLPSTATGDVSVDIHGLSFLLQAVTGTLDDVTLTSDDLVISGVPLDLDVDLADVPLSSGGTTGPVSGTVTVGQDAVNALQAVKDTGGTVTLGAGEVTFDRTLDVPLLGSVPVKVVEKPALSEDGKTLTLTPTSASVPGSALAIDQPQILSAWAQNICLAQYLPSAVTLTGITVAADDVTIAFRSDGLALSSSTFNQKGAC